MKIRIKGNSLRYRLTQSDVKHFVTEGYIEETTNFGNRVFTYALQRSIDDQLDAEFNGDKITLFMPCVLAGQWYNTDIIGFEHHTPTLYLLVEKDFVCLDNTLEDQSDNYPNPNMVC